MKRKLIATSERIRIRAKTLRHTTTTAEQILWRKLRDRRFHGIKFRRQVPLGFYIADFCAAEVKLIVELDGGGHAETLAYDCRRDFFFRMQGYIVLHFENHLIHENLDGVLERIHNALTPTLSRFTEEGGL